MQLEPVTIELGQEPPISLRLRQLDGVTRIAFAAEAAAIAETLAGGGRAGEDFDLGDFAPLPVSTDAVARAQRLQIELTLALEWAWLSAEGIERPETRPALARLVRLGDPAAAVPPLFQPLSRWLLGPLLEIEREGEPSGPLPNGGMAGALTTAGTAAP